MACFWNMFHAREPLHVGRPWHSPRLLIQYLFSCQNGSHNASWITEALRQTPTQGHNACYQVPAVDRCGTGLWYWFRHRVSGRTAYKRQNP